MRSLKNFCQLWRACLTAVVIGVASLYIYLASKKDHRDEKKGVVTPQVQPSSPLQFFGPEEYKNALLLYPIVEKNCHNVTKLLVPHYTICTHDVPDDRVVSGSFHHGASYEREESKLLIRMANYSAGKQSPSSSAVAVIDGGAHLGTHTLTLARFGYQVWAVDPLPMNTVKLYHSLGLSGIGYNNVHLIQNTLDWTRNATTLAIERANVGGTIIVPEKRRGATHVEAQSVLLSDVIHDILGHPQYENKKTVTLIMKLDIESYECRTIIGSRQIFDHPRLYIPYIVMEWRYCAKLFPGTNKCDFPPSCPDELLKNMTMLLVSKHYDPTSSKGLPLNPENSLLWRPMNVVWQHKSARRVLP